jgi:hypothetical protein
MDEMLVNIMAELLSTLALATKEVHDKSTPLHLASERRDV